MIESINFLKNSTIYTNDIDFFFKCFQFPSFSRRIEAHNFKFSSNLENT